MAMLRVLIVVLVLLNLGVWSWGAGYWSAYLPLPNVNEDRQPHRWLDQYEPQRFELIAPPVVASEPDAVQQKPFVQPIASAASAAVASPMVAEPPKLDSQQQQKSAP